MSANNSLTDKINTLIKELGIPDDPAHKSIFSQGVIDGIEGEDPSLYKKDDDPLQSSWLSGMHVGKALIESNPLLYLAPGFRLLGMRRELKQKGFHVAASVLGKPYGFGESIRNKEFADKLNEFTQYGHRQALHDLITDNSFLIETKEELVAQIERAETAWEKKRLIHAYTVSDTLEDSEKVQLVDISFLLDKKNDAGALKMLTAIIEASEQHEELRGNLKAWFATTDREALASLSNNCTHEYLGEMDFRKAEEAVQKALLKTKQLTAKKEKSSLAACGNKERSFMTEFPGFSLPEGLMTYLNLGGWEDTSWHNEACPSFSRGNKRLWVNAEDPKQREQPTMPRFMMTLENDEGEHVKDIGSCESIGDAMLMMSRADHLEHEWQFKKPEDFRRYFLYLGFQGLEYHIDDPVEDIVWSGPVSDDQVAVLRQNHASLWQAAESLGIDPWSQWASVAEIELMQKMRGGFAYKDNFIVDPFLSECGRFPVNPLKAYGGAFLKKPGKQPDGKKNSPEI